MGGIQAILTALAVGAANDGRTDFGVRELDRVTVAPVQQGVNGEVTYRPLQRGSSTNLRALAALASRWGRVTSTWRSPDRNRRVGGVSNSYHLSGRAIDIARRPHVSHAQIAQDLRRNGYHLIESFDEGDHSHFAFGSGAPFRTAIQAVREPSSGGTAWRIVSAPR